MYALSGDSDLEAIPVLPGDVLVTMPELPIKLNVTTVQQFKAISDPTRSRILGIIQNQPATAKQIADRLGATPGAIGHHLHMLEAAGLAKVIARRLVRGIVANYYTRTARIFTYDFLDEIAGGTSGSLEIMSKARDELVEALVGVESDPHQTMAFPHARLSPERAQAYFERIEALIEDLLHEPSDPNGQVYGVFVAIFKSPAYIQGSPAASEAATSGDDGENA